MAKKVVGSGPKNRQCEDVRLKIEKNWLSVKMQDILSALQPSTTTTFLFLLSFISLTLSCDVMDAVVVLEDKR